MKSFLFLYPSYLVAISILASVFIIMTILYTSCQLNYTVFVLLWLAYFTYYNGLWGPSMLLHMVEFSPFLRLNNIPVCVCASHFLYLFIHWWTLRFFPMFWLLWTMLQWTWNGKYLSKLLIYFGCIYRSEFAGSYDNSVFNFLRNHHTVFWSGCAILHSTK